MHTQDIFRKDDAVETEERIWIVEVAKAAGMLWIEEAVWIGEVVRCERLPWKGEAAKTGEAG